MPVATKRIRVLLIEADKKSVANIRKLLAAEKRFSFSLQPAERFHKGLKLLGKSKFDVVLLSLALPDAKGSSGLTKIHAQAPELPVVVLGTVSTETSARKLLERGAQDYLIQEHFDERMLSHILRCAIERHAIHKQLRQTNQELQTCLKVQESLIHNDAVTGLLNRHGLEQMLKREVQWASRQGTPLLSVLVDLDNFSKINDQLGQHVGDVVLKEISKRLRSASRAIDHAARVGGDKFVLLLPKTRPAEGIRVAERLRVAIAQNPIITSPQKVKLTASLAVFAVPIASSLDDLLSHSQPLLYMSKQAGKNHVVYGPDSAKEVENRPLSDILKALRQKKSFRSAVQPILQLKDETPAGYEFLSRATIPVFEMPEDFFLVAQEANMLTVVDQLCFKVCAEAAASFRPKGRRHLNLFPSTLLNLSVPALLDLIPSGKGKQDYCIEISEQQIIGDPAYLTGTIQALKKAGFAIAIDDVGFGHSSLESVIVLEPSIIKVDKKWVQGISEHKAAQRSLKRLLKMSKSLGAQTIAEGIETSEDLKTLKQLGVPYGQGYFWGKPKAAT